MNGQLSQMPTGILDYSGIEDWLKPYLMGQQPVLNSGTNVPNMGTPTQPAMEDPRTMGLLQAGLALMAQGGPSKMPVNIGQAIGNAGQAGLQAYNQANLMNMQQQKLDKENSPFGKINPSDFTPESMRKFAMTRNWGDLVAVTKAGAELKGHYFTGGVEGQPGAKREYFAPASDPTNAVPVGPQYSQADHVPNLVRRAEILVDAPNDSPVWKDQFPNKDLSDKEKEDWRRDSRNQLERYAKSIAAGRPSPEEYGQRVAAGEGSKIAKTDFEAARKTALGIDKILETKSLIASGQANTGAGAEFMTEIQNWMGKFGGSEAAFDRASKSQMLDALMGSEVFGMISTLGIGARGLDTPAEVKFMRKVLTGSPNLTQEALMGMATLRQKTMMKNLAQWDERVLMGAGAVKQFHDSAGLPMRPIGGQLYESYIDEMLASPENKNETRASVIKYGIKTGVIPRGYK